MFKQEVDDFFDVNNILVDRLATVKELGVKYIFWGPNERGLGDWNPAEGGFLNEIYNKDGYYIFEVEDG
jgi:hypothetical protein